MPYSMDKDSRDPRDSVHSDDSLSQSPWPITDPQAVTPVCGVCEIDVQVFCCVACNNFNFCNTCWDKQILHKQGTLGLNGIPHERADPVVVNRLKEIFKPPGDESQQRKRHKEDQDTTWFSVEQAADELPVLCGHGRYATLMGSSGSGGSSRYPRLVSFVGQTGAGKSTLIKILIQQKFNPNIREAKPAYRTPIPGSGNQDIRPTTGDVHLYADPASFLSEAPILYADCEGFDAGGAEPFSVTVRQNEIQGGNLEADDRQSLNEQNMAFALAFTPREFRRELKWAANDPERRKREYAVAELFPRLLYAFSDVIVFVIQNARTFEIDVLRRLIDWAEIPMEKSTNQARLPCGIIAVNATENDIDEKQWDCDHATDSLMSAIKDVIYRDHRYRDLAEKWRKQERNINTTEDLLHCYYSSIRIVRIPRKEHAVLVLEQVSKLYNEIYKDCDYAFRGKRAATELPNVEEFQQYIEFAFDHFSQTIDAPFDFVEAGIRVNPIPRGLKDNILRLAVQARKWENFADRLDDTFKQLGIIVASCIVLDCVRQRRPGRYIDLFEEHYANFCIDAFNSFSDSYWPCSYSNPKKGSCVNTKGKHTKGHQNKHGQIIGGGNYENLDLSQRFRDAWVTSIKKNVLRAENEHTTKRTSEDLHRNAIRTSYQQLGKAHRFQSHSTCFCCLREMPEHPLPCGHVLCEPCVLSYGDMKDGFTIELNECPLHETDFEIPWLVRLKPIDAGARILSLDGGGIRGIIELEVLHAIEQYLDDKIPIRMFFDLIVGTSTGGLIALGLGVKQLPVEECIQWYQKLSKKAFTTKILPGPSGLSTRYRTKPFEVALKEAFQETNLFGGPQKDASSYLIKVAVTAATETGEKAVVFANYNRSDTPGQVYKFARQDSGQREMKVWEAARATSAAPGYFEPFYKRETNEFYVDGAIFHNNPVNVALQESRAIWSDNGKLAPDILLSLGSGHSAKGQVEESLSEIEPENFMHRHFCAPLANLVFGQGPKYTQRWFWEDYTLFRSISILKHLTGSAINAEQQWKQFKTTALEASERDEGRFCRFNPQLSGEIPALDEYRRMDSLQKEVKQLLRDPTCRKTIAQIAHRLVASSFYFSVTDMSSDGNARYYFHGSILCRFPDGSQELRNLGSVLRKHQFEKNTPLFRIPNREPLSITSEIISEMNEKAHFCIDDITILLSARNAQALITFEWFNQELGEVQIAPISGFPRPLFHERAKEKFHSKKISSPSIGWSRSSSSLQSKF